ncbi:MAG: ABC transporter ATP-binding protein [Deltaproteobacteria bacterium]|nr:ABC transporter ATP-binding protein [Deltaproteobacteria bacterium]
MLFRWESQLLELNDIHKSFTHNQHLIEVLKGIDLSVKPGDSISIMGASGVGKSTLLNVMATLEPPTKGTVQFDNQDVSELDGSDLCKLRNREIGLVFQFHHLLPEFNALENTLIPALIARKKKKEAAQKAEEILVKVGLKQRMNHRMGELSGGEQQRVAIARALIMAPRLLLADEPTGNLDRNTGEGIMDLLLRLNEEDGLALVVATHNPQLAEKMSQPLEIIDGRILRSV